MRLSTRPPAGSGRTGHGLSGLGRQWNACRVAQEILWTDIVTSIGTVGAVGTALWLGVVEVRRFNRSEVRNRQTQERAQAAQLAAWVEVHPYYSERSDEPEGFHGDVSVINPSGRPLYDLQLSTLVAPWDDESREVAGPPEPTNWDLGVLPPGAVRTTRYRDVGYASDSPITCTFRDADDHWWRHTETGYLERLSGDPRV